MQKTVILHSRSPRCSCAGGKSSHLEWRRSICHEKNKSQETRSFLILQISRELLHSFHLSIFTQTCLHLAATPVTNFKKQSFSHGLSDALSAEGGKAENQRPCIIISCTAFEVWTVTEGKLTRVYLQVSPDHIHYLHGDSLWKDLLKKVIFLLINVTFSQS